MGNYSSKRVFSRFNEQQRKAYGDYARYILAFVYAGQECALSGTLRGYIQWWDSTERRWLYHSPDGVVMEWREALKAWAKVR